MNTREDLDRFMTPASHALVEQFTAEASSGDDDVDMDEVIRQNLADHEAALAGEPELAGIQNPKPVIGYLVTDISDDLTSRPNRGWYFLPPLDLSIKAAEKTRAAFQAMSSTTPPKPIYKVTVTFEAVEGGHG